MLFYEDLEVGQVREVGQRHVSKQEIIRFAREWDPAPFHVDEEAARATVFGGLTASSCHTYSIASGAEVFVMDSSHLVRCRPAWNRQPMSQNSIPRASACVHRRRVPGLIPLVVSMLAHGAGGGSRSGWSR